MALIPCVECGRKVSTKAASCPGCGAPISLSIAAAEEAAAAAEEEEEAGESMAGPDARVPPLPLTGRVARRAG